MCPFVMALSLPASIVSALMGDLTGGRLLSADFVSTQLSEPWSVVTTKRELSIWPSLTLYTYLKNSTPNKLDSKWVE